MVSDIFLKRRDHRSSSDYKLPLKTLRFVTHDTKQFIMPGYLLATVLPRSGNKQQLSAETRYISTLKNLMQFFALKSLFSERKVVGVVSLLPTVAATC